MNKIKKFLKKLPKKQLRQILIIINKMEQGNTKGLDVKKLSSYKDIFRVRSGNIRILFLHQDDSFFLVEIERRSDTTYKL